MSILIADDDATVRIVLEQTLRQQGHKVVAAVNGREALKLAIEVNPQLVISDWVMPELDGLMLCRALRETEAGAAKPSGGQRLDANNGKHRCFPARFDHPYFG